MPKPVQIEKMVFPSECAEMLGTNVNNICAAKLYLGIRRRKVFPSELQRFFKKYPRFTSSDVYAKKEAK